MITYFSSNLKGFMEVMLKYKKILLRITVSNSSLSQVLPG